MDAYYSNRDACCILTIYHTVCLSNLDIFCALCLRFIYASSLNLLFGLSLALDSDE